MQKERDIMIRSANEKDINGLAKLMGELGYPTTEIEMDQRFKKINANPLYNTIVAEINGEIVGMIGIIIGYRYEKNEDYIRIVALVVASDYRKQGIGGKLIREVEKLAKKQGIKSLVLNSGNRKDRNDAHQFYIQNGFEGRATGFYKELQ